MINSVIEATLQTLEISGIVFLMMVLVDFFDVRTRGHIKQVINRSRWNQYLSASLLGVTPGCLGAYVNVSMYMHGFLGLGGIAAGMIATSGDEAFVMLVQFPKTALILFLILFLVAMPLGGLLDYLAAKFKITRCSDCAMHKVHSQDESRNYKHYFTVHIWQHLFRNHMVRIILWTFFSLLIIKIGLNYFMIDKLVNENIIWVILLAALIGFIPASGPHLVFVSLFAVGAIPFSVLLASSVSQDGHGMLPMYSYSLRDSIIVKMFNFTAAIVIGFITFLSGF